MVTTRMQFFYVRAEHKWKNRPEYGRVEVFIIGNSLAEDPPIFTKRPAFNTSIICIGSISVTLWPGNTTFVITVLSVSIIFANVLTLVISILELKLMPASKAFFYRHW